MQITLPTLSKRAVAIIAAACLLALCIAGTTIAGIQGSGFARVAVYGRITGFGSIIVNGVEYATTDARISVDGRAGDQRQLRIGQIVTLHGSVDADGRTGTADDVSFEGDVRGTITAFDRQARVFSVLGQTVRMTDETLTNGPEIRVGSAVEVSGFVSSAGEIVASRVDVERHARSSQVRGAVKALDRNAHTFMINTLLVDYQDARIDGELADGAIVLAQGESQGSAVLLTAKRVRVSEALGTPGEKGKLEGLITSFSSAAEFDLNGQHVVGDEHTHYVLQGGTLQTDAFVRVSGRFAGGTLVADKVEMKQKGSKR